MATIGELRQRKPLPLWKWCNAAFICRGAKVPYSLDQEFTGLHMLVIRDGVPNPGFHRTCLRRPWLSNAATIVVVGRYAQQAIWVSADATLIAASPPSHESCSATGLLHLCLTSMTNTLPLFSHIGLSLYEYVLYRMASMNPDQLRFRPTVTHTEHLT
jgi:hypothetical protein